MNAPYDGNILCDGLGRILSREDVLKGMLVLPPPAKGTAMMSREARLHCLASIRDLHIPSLEGLRIQQTIDLSLRQSYRYRSPMAPETWGRIAGEQLHSGAKQAPATAALIDGYSGVGKTEAVLRPLYLYPQQVIVHQKFPNLVGEHFQMAWLSVNVPASGRACDLAIALMLAWEAALQRVRPDFCGRFAQILSREHLPDGGLLMTEWSRVAGSHFLGVLHLDEVQNLFKLPSLKGRKVREELSIVEDKALRSILTLLNVWQIPVIFSATPDGTSALTRRFATAQRCVTGGYHAMRHFERPDNPVYVDLIERLCAAYQFTAKPLPFSTELAVLVHGLTGGVFRLIILLWVAAHRVAFERTDGSLTARDFTRAVETLLAPIIPAVEALKSGDPTQMRRYEDLIRREGDLWISLCQT